MAHRSWLKVMAENWLRGTMREEHPAIRGLFVDLLALTADGAFADEGFIQVAVDVGLTDEQIESILHVTKKQWEFAKERLVKTDRIVVEKGNVIKIVNWKKYQSEYQRTKHAPSRKSKKDNKNG